MHGNVAKSADLAAAIALIKGNSGTLASTR